MKNRNLRGYKIFIASPDDLYNSHNLVKETIHKFNWLHAIKSGVIFIPFNHKEVPGGCSNNGAQELINKAAFERDYAIIMFGKKLGKETQNYRSGTIEEYERSKNLIKEGKMLDLLVLVKSPRIVLDEISGMSKELEEYSETRTYIEDTLHAESFCKPFNNEGDIIQELNSFLNRALGDLGGKKEKEVSVSDVKDPSEI